MSSAENLIKHNEVAINPFMMYRAIFHQRKKKKKSNLPFSVVPNNTYGCYLTISFFIQLELCQKKPLKTTLSKLLLKVGLTSVRSSCSGLCPMCFQNLQGQRIHSLFDQLSSVLGHLHHEKFSVTIASCPLIVPP